jgi:hypothetical protein
LSYILSFVITGVFFFALHSFTELNKKQKIGATLIVLMVIMGAFFYNEYSASQSTKVRHIEILFVQGKSLTCNGIEVNSTNFSYSDGTQTFIGKKETPFEFEMISAYKCQ